jgi:hypothetical protein
MTTWPISTKKPLHQIKYPRTKKFYFICLASIAAAIAILMFVGSPYILGQSKAQGQAQQEEELMIQVPDNTITEINESGSRPALVIEELEDGSVIVFTKVGKQRVANYDNIDSMLLGLGTLLPQMSVWNFTK